MWSHAERGTEVSENMKLRAILFDFDFTLADSTAGAVECANHALVRCGYPAAEREAIRRCVAYPLPEVFSRLTGVDGDPAAAAAFAIRLNILEIPSQRIRKVENIVAADQRGICQRIRLL